MDKNINANTDTQETEEMVVFCRKCGNQLANEMTVCEQCGTAVLNEQIESIEDLPFNNDEYEESKRRLRKKKGLNNRYYNIIFYRFSRCRILYQ